LRQPASLISFLQAPRIGQNFGDLIPYFLFYDSYKLCT